MQPARQPQRQGIGQWRAGPAAHPVEQRPALARFQQIAHRRLIVNDLVVKSFPDIFNVEFTARMEDELDRVEAAEVNAKKILEGFYAPFSSELEAAAEGMLSMKGVGASTGIPCPQCGSELHIKVGKKTPMTLAHFGWGSGFNVLDDAALPAVLVGGEVRVDGWTAGGGVRAVLEASQCRWDWLVDVTVYLTDMQRDFQAYNAVWAEYFPDINKAPCRTTLGITALPTPISIELKCVAHVPERR